GSTGDAYDNAMAESFFATLEREVLNRRRFSSQAEARMAIFQWLEGWYCVFQPSRSMVPVDAGPGFRRKPGRCDAVVGLSMRRPV
ncbi:MAG TPA: integrase core domain-containing protein, partial [Zeimonas sp.]|nr:integrase core domain-containing protein [Zeimonas sp.]